MRINRSEEGRRNLCARASSKQFTESFEHPPAVECLFTEPGDDNHCLNHHWNDGRIAGDEVIGLIDRWCAQERHNDRFHDKLQGDAKNDPTD